MSLDLRTVIFISVRVFHFYLWLCICLCCIDKKEGVFIGGTNKFKRLVIPSIIFSLLYTFMEWI